MVHHFDWCASRHGRSRHDVQRQSFFGDADLGLPAKDVEERARRQDEGVPPPGRRKTEIADNELEVRILVRFEDRPREPTRRIADEWILRRGAFEPSWHFGWRR